MSIEQATYEKGHPARGSMAAKELVITGNERGAENRRWKEQRTVAERFWSRVKKTDGCWIWTGPLGRSGHGKNIWVSRECGHARPHRVAFALVNGPIPRGLCVLHSRKCTTAACVRPDHLRLGTQRENRADADALGRSGGCYGRKGSRSPLAKLTENMIPEIRRRLAAGESQSAIARSLGMNQGTISHIALGKTWRHVP